MTKYDPHEFAVSLSAKLAARSRHLCMFLGAGAACACGLPDVAGLQASVRSTLRGDDRTAFDRQVAGRNIEQALSRLRRISSLVAGNDTIDGLTGAKAKKLDGDVCQGIVKALDSTGKDIAPMLSLAAWLARADYQKPVELFTTNYDLLLEAALEELAIPYFDGFVGNVRARFQIELVEACRTGADGYLPAQFIRLWKLHGSVNWLRTEDGHIVRMGQPVASNLPAAIYPSDTKYEESQRVPFVVLQDRFRHALNEPETLVLISGYSFGDAHLNEMLFDAATRRQRSEFVVFWYDGLSEELAQRASKTPNIQLVGTTEAVLGGVRGTWTRPNEDIPNLWQSGKMLLPDFAHLATYLARSSSTRTAYSPGSAQAGSPNVSGTHGGPSA